MFKILKNPANPYGWLIFAEIKSADIQWKHALDDLFDFMKTNVALLISEDYVEINLEQSNGELIEEPEFWELIISDKQCGVQLVCDYLCLLGELFKSKSLLDGIEYSMGFCDENILLGEYALVAVSKRLASDAHEGDELTYPMPHVYQCLSTYLQSIEPTSTSLTFNKALCNLIRKSPPHEFDVESMKHIAIYLLEHNHDSTLGFDVLSKLRFNENEMLKHVINSKINEYDNTILEDLYVAIAMAYGSSDAKQHVIDVIVNIAGNTPDINSFEKDDFDGGYIDTLEQNSDLEIERKRELNLKMNTGYHTYHLAQREWLLN